MKIKTEHYALIETGVKRYLAESPDLTVEAYAKMGYSPMRYRWDVLWCSIRKNYLPNIFNDLYAYLNDDHIDTALRRITNTK